MFRADRGKPDQQGGTQSYLLRSAQEAHADQSRERTSLQGCDGVLREEPGRLQWQGVTALRRLPPSLNSGKDQTMQTAQRAEFVTVEDYLDGEKVSEVKHE